MSRVFWDGPVQEFKGERGGVLQLGETRKVILCSTFSGHFEQALAKQIMDHGNRMARAHGRFIFFGEWSEMTGYDASCRVSMTKWALSLGPSLEGLHIVFESKLVAMGIAVASIALKELHGYTSTKEFLRVFGERRARAQS